MKIRFPSDAAAILCGAVVLPLFLFSLRWLDRAVGGTLPGDFFLLLWCLAGFAGPLLAAIADFSYIKKRNGAAWNVFTPLHRKEDRVLFFVPAWRRATLWLASALLSLFMLDRCGVAFP